MTLVEITCPVCNKKAKKYTGHVNRANKIGAQIYCGKPCSAIARMNFKTDEQKKAEKSEYDKMYRVRESETIKVKKAEAFQRDYKANPEKYKAIRNKRMAAHVEYCRNPEYKKKKKVYDREYKAVGRYGPVIGELVVLILKIADEVRDPDGRKDSVRVNTGVYNKSQKRMRKWKTLMRNP